MKDVVARLQRELPDTDRDRYDIAYQRGRAQARSALVGGGLAIGSAIGAGLMWLMDPERGAGRRAELASRFEGLRNTVARTASGKATDVSNRVQGFAIERGIKQPPAESGEATNGSGTEQVHADAAWSRVSHPGSYAESTVGRGDAAGTSTATSAATMTGASQADTTSYGEGYREGFGATVADPTAPGSSVAEPITRDEVVEHGSSGPVAGAAHEDRPSVVSSQTVEEEEAATSR